MGQTSAGMHRRLDGNGTLADTKAVSQQSGQENVPPAMQDQDPAELYRLALDGAVPMFIGLLRRNATVVASAPHQPGKQPAGCTCHAKEQLCKALQAQVTCSFCRQLNCRQGKLYSVCRPMWTSVFANCLVVLRVVMQCTSLTDCLAMSVHCPVLDAVLQYIAACTCNLTLLCPALCTCLQRCCLHCDFMLYVQAFVTLCDLPCGFRMM